MLKGAIVDSAQDLYATAGDSDKWIHVDFLRKQYNYVMHEIAWQTCCYPVSTTDSLVASQRLYIVPAGWFAFMPGGVQTADSGALSGPRSLKVIVNESKDWRTHEGTPNEWYQGDAGISITVGTLVEAEYLGVGNDILVDFTCANTPVVDGTAHVYKAGVLQVLVTDYTIVLATGVITFLVAPAAGEHITVRYYHGTTALTNWAIGLRPVPDSDGVDELYLAGWGLPAATDVTAAGDASAPPWPEPYHEILTWGLCVRAAIRDQDRGKGNKAAMTYFQTEYQSMLVAFREACLRGVDPIPLVRGEGAGAPVGTYDTELEAYVPRTL